MYIQELQNEMFMWGEMKNPTFHFEQAMLEDKKKINKVTSETMKFGKIIVDCCWARKFIAWLNIFIISIFEPTLLLFEDMLEFLGSMSYLQKTEAS